MKTFSTFFVVLCVLVLAACGGSPTGPSSMPSTSPVANPTPPPSQPSQLTLTPGSATMSTGQSLTFMATGADGRNYSFSAGPAWVLRVDQSTPNSVKVTMVGREANYGWVNVTGWNGSNVVETTATITLR